MKSICPGGFNGAKPVGLREEMAQRASVSSWCPVDLGLLRRAACLPACLRALRPVLPRSVHRSTRSCFPVEALGPQQSEGPVRPVPGVRGPQRLCQVCLNPHSTSSVIWVPMWTWTPHRIGGAFPLCSAGASQTQVRCQLQVLGLCRPWAWGQVLTPFASRLLGSRSKFWGDLGYFLYHSALELPSQLSVSLRESSGPQPLQGPVPPQLPWRCWLVVPEFFVLLLPAAGVLPG